MASLRTVHDHDGTVSLRWNHEVDIQWCEACGLEVADEKVHKAWHKHLAGALRIAGSTFKIQVED